MNIDYEILGKRIAILRKKKSLTQEKLSEKAEITNNYLSNIENNHSIPSLETLIKICSALEVTPNEILLGTVNNTKEYLNKEISEKFNNCTPEEKRLILSIVKLISEGKYKN